MGQWKVFIFVGLYFHDGGFHTIFFFPRCFVVASTTAAAAAALYK